MLIWHVVRLIGAVSAINTQVRLSDSAHKDDGVKIVGGNDAKQNQYPFAAYIIKDDGTWLCSASLVGRRWAMTNAHCTGVASHVVLGDYSRPENDTTEQVIEIEEKFDHPDYNFPSHDIALVKLAKPADVRSDAVATIPLLKSKSYYMKMMADKKNCRLFGWGATITNDGFRTMTKKLQTIRMRIVNQTEVESRDHYTYNYGGMMATEVIYREGPCRYGSPCPGDSGSPFACRKNGKWLQTGVLSFGYLYDGCVNGLKGVANVFEHYTWIKSIMNS